MSQVQSENGLATVQHKELVPIVKGQLAPTSMEGLWRLANLYCQAGMLPAGVKSPEQVFICLEAGMSIGLSPAQAIQSVMVVNNRPTLFGDAALGVCQASGQLTDIREYHESNGDSLRAVCEVIRKDRASPTVSVFSVADAKNAGLWGKAGPWKQYPKRMLQMRARAFALRDAFPDYLKGIGIREEVDDYQPIPARGDNSELVNRRKAMLDAQPPVVEVEPEPAKPTKRVADAGPVTEDDIDTILGDSK